MTTLSKEDVARIPREAADMVSHSLEQPQSEPLEDFDPLEFSIIGMQQDPSGPKPPLLSLKSPLNKLLPEVYLPPGTNYARFYRDPKGKWRREYPAHRVGPRIVPCLDEMQCPICQRLSQLPTGWGQRWVYRRRIVSVTYALLESFRPRRAHVKLREPVLLWGYEQFGEQLGRIVDRLGSNEAIEEFFNPEADHKFVEIEHDFHFSHVAMCWSSRVSKPIPPLPRDVAPLSLCMCPANQPPDPKKMGRFLKKMARDCEDKWEIRRRRYPLVAGKLRTR